MTQQTAISLFRTYAINPMGQEARMPTLLRKFFEEKDYDFGMMYPFRRTNTITNPIVQLLLRGRGTTDIPFILKAMFDAPDMRIPIKKYVGTPQQNIAIERALTLFNQPDNFYGEGAAASLNIGVHVTNSIQNTAIAIIGGGAAGIITAASLYALGFRNITIHEKRQRLGIWSQPNVFGGTKNNPRKLLFRDQAALDTAAGNGTKDGAHVANFLTRLYDTMNVKNSGGNFNIKIGKRFKLFRDTAEHEYQEFDIAINCVGTGKPRDFRNNNRMELDDDSERPVAIRWQQQLTRADVENKRFVFIGLGNSTAEMIQQMHHFQDQGVDCDYHVLTHYPEEALHNPNETVLGLDRDHEHVTYRVFRDLNKPELTNFQGDLGKSRSDYYQALLTGRLHGDVESWSVRKNKLAAYHRRSGSVEEIKFDRLYGLIGYEHTYDVYARYGITRNNDGVPYTDYDGEFRTASGKVIKGYFGMGAILDSPLTRNTTVIPGMMSRMPDLLFGVLMRALEIQHAKEIQSIEKTDYSEDDESL